MDRDAVLKFLEEKLAKYKKDEPQAFNCIGAYEYVINDLMNED